VAFWSPRRVGGSISKSPWYWCRARPICLRLLAQLMRLADSRAFCTAGRSRPIRREMMASTTSNSTRVKPRRLWAAARWDMADLLCDERGLAARAAVPRGADHSNRVRAANKQFPGASAEVDHAPRDLQAQGTVAAESRRGKFQAQ